MFCHFVCLMLNKTLFYIFFSHVKFLNIKRFVFPIIKLFCAAFSSFQDFEVSNLRSTSGPRNQQTNKLEIGRHIRGYLLK